MAHGAGDASSLTAPWDRIRVLLDQLVSSNDRDQFLDRCVDTIVDVVGADRGLVVLWNPEGSPLVVNARGRGRALSPLEREEVSRTVLAQAERERRAVLWEADGETARTESIAALGILAAIATPLRLARWRPHGDEPARGALYVDFRGLERTPTKDDIAFIEVAAALVALAVEHAEELELTREHLRVAEASSGGTAPPNLQDLLAPPGMAGLREEVRSALSSNSPLLVVGESGVGKTLLVSAIARASGRSPIVRAMLGSSDDLNTIASELFGHVRGAFSGALTKRTGLVELAEGGTLILDELLNLPVEAQKLLLDFAQFGDYRPLGWDRSEPKRAVVRLIVCTNGDPIVAMREGRLRQDLYYRLAGTTLRIPPLRKRREDIPHLAEAHLIRIDPAYSWKLSLRMRQLLVSPELDWPGNVRQLHSVIERARDRTRARSADARVIDVVALDPEDLGLEQLPMTTERAAEPEPTVVPDSADLRERWGKLQAERSALEEEEREIIQAAIDRHAGVIAHAARELGVARTSLASRMQTLSVSRRGDHGPI